jgi:hypothetical protein
VYHSTRQLHYSGHLYEAEVLTGDLATRRSFVSETRRGRSATSPWRLA